MAAKNTSTSNVSNVCERCALLLCTLTFITEILMFNTEVVNLKFCPKSRRFLVGCILSEMQAI